MRPIRMCWSVVLSAMAALQTGIQMMTADTVELPFDQLCPHGRYRVQERPGHILQSSSHGTLAISLQHQGRQSLTLLPVE